MIGTEREKHEFFFVIFGFEDDPKEGATETFNVKEST